MSSSPKSGMGTALAAIAIVIALAAVAVNFVVAGPTGPTGAKGATGAAGTNGTNGAPGAKGNPGTNGINGTNGTNGVNGTNGTNGTNGAPGPQGPPGPAGLALWAVVSAHGVLTYGNGATGASQLFNGTYQVVFDQNVSQCSFNAALGLTTSLGSGPNGSVTTAARLFNPDAVWVQTWNASGSLVNSSFHLSVECTWGLWAVVSATGVLVRGNNVQGAVNEGPGGYVVDFNQNVENCSFIATLGDVGAGASGPGFITVAGASGDQNGVFVATYAVGGAFVNSSFDVLAECTSSTWAVVSSTGGLVRGSASGATQIGNGTYEVDFSQDIQNCAITATVGETGSSGALPASTVSTAGRFGNDMGVWVTIYDSTGTLTNESFHMAVFC